MIYWSFSIHFNIIHLSISVLDLYQNKTLVYVQPLIVFIVNSPVLLNNIQNAVGPTKIQLRILMCTYNC